MSKYDRFIFESYDFDANDRLLTLHYSLDGKLNFVETYKFDFDFVDYDKVLLDRALLTLFMLAGVSYYKAYVPPNMLVKQGELDERMAAFFSKTYERGLGEFWYVNGLDPRTPVNFTATHQDGKLESRQSSTHNKGRLVAVGGGKDSLVSIEILRPGDDITTWSLNHRSQLTPLVERIGLRHLWVERTWDEKLLKLNQQDAYNGHIPISAIFAAVGVVIAVLSGKQDIVVSNEQSANEPSLNYRGVPINHQYSKSQEFEQDFQSYLAHIFSGDAVRYYSLLRPFSEVRIAEFFSQLGFDKYQDVFSSCNRAFTHGSRHMSWCGHCAKCAFTFMALTPFVARSDLEKLWGGKNLLLDPALEPLYGRLLGIESDKPLDCVGEIKESRAAMRLAQRIYPELDKYRFEIPLDYDFRAWSGHAMPPEIFSMLKARLEAFY